MATMLVKGQVDRPGAATFDGSGGAQGQPLRVAIYDDHPLFVDGVAQALAASGGFDVVVRATTAEQLLHALERTPVDVILIEPWGGAGDGLDSLTAVSGRHPSTAIIALSGMSDSSHVKQALANGAHGYVAKDTRGADLPSLIRHVAAGSMVLPSGSGNRATGPDLTAREAEVLAHAARGRSNSEIGKALFVTEQTVKFHLGNIYRKMGVGNRTEAAHEALRHGLIS